MTDAVTTAAGEEVLGARALNYRKVVIALCVVVIGIYLIPGVDVTKLSVFGLTLEGNERQRRGIVVGIAWLFLFYHSFFFLYYAYRDFRFWELKLTTKPAADNSAFLFFPEARMYLGLPPATKEVRRAIRDMIISEWKTAADKGWVTWRPVRPDDVPKEYHAATYRVPLTLYKRVRAKILWFFTVDVAIPLALVFVAFVLTAAYR